MQRTVLVGMMLILKQAERLQLQHSETTLGTYALLPFSNFTADSGAPGEFRFRAMNLSHMPTGPLLFPTPGGVW